MQFMSGVRKSMDADVKKAERGDPEAISRLKGLLTSMEQKPYKDYLPMSTLQDIINKNDPAKKAEKVAETKRTEANDRNAAASRRGSAAKKK
jgi:hypothetical protein